MEVLFRQPAQLELQVQRVDGVKYVGKGSVVGLRRSLRGKGAGLAATQERVADHSETEDRQYRAKEDGYDGFRVHETQFTRVGKRSKWLRDGDRERNAAGWEPGPGRVSSGATKR